MTTQSYTTFPQTHHITPSLVNFQRKKSKQSTLKKWQILFQWQFCFSRPASFSFRYFFFLYPKQGEDNPPPPRPLCSGTLSDNYVRTIQSRKPVEISEKKEHVVEGPSCVVYCYGCESSINLSCVLLTCLEPRPGPATPQLAPPLITVSILVTSSTSKTYGWLSNPVTKINIDAFLTYNVPPSFKFGRFKPLSIS